jgi:hypothetical protein
VCEHLFANAKRVYVAGDDDQAIYRWAGADVSHLQTCVGPRTVLEKSYRLPASVWRQAQGILTNIGQRVPKTWTHRGEEGTVQVLAAAEHAPIATGEWLMLARTRWAIKEVSNDLWRRGVPCTIFGTSTVSQRHVAGIRAWDRLRQGEALAPAEVAAVYTLTSGVPEDYNCDGLPKDQLFTHADLAKAHGLRTPVTADWFAALDLIPYSTCQFYERCHINGHDIMAAPRIHLNTVHAVKGGECDNVLLLADVTSQMGATLRQPATEECDDEHRVFYVGATRARHALYAARAGGPNEYPLPCFYE